MKTRWMLPIAPVMDAAGFYQVAAMAPVSFETAAMYLYENPWERLRLLRRHMPGTEFDFLVRSRNVVGWFPKPNDVVELFLRTLRNIGINSIKVFDGLNDYRNVAYHIEVGKELGFHVKALLNFAVSPVHTDDYFTAKARQLQALGVDAIVIADACGAILPERARTLIGRVRAELPDMELHFSTHPNSGVATPCYREAIRQGIDVLWGACTPLANGHSFPPHATIVQLASEEGRAVDLDQRCLREMDDWFYWAAYQENRPCHEPDEFDPVAYEQTIRHQIPGGMMSNLESQLAGVGMSHRLPEVLEEAGRVRAELGYPVMVTPFSQFVGVQATLNVVTGERYSSVPREMALYCRGYYGQSPGPIDPNVLDRIAGDQPMIDPTAYYHDKMVEKVRAERGALSDEELLTAIFLNPTALETFNKHRKPIQWDAEARMPLLALLKELAKRPRLRVVDVRCANLRIGLSKDVTAAACPVTQAQAELVHNSLGTSSGSCAPLEHTASSPCPGASPQRRN
jgi:oxaloacetate decarboxylase (Na+ extruding) subunit alpha